MPGFPTLPSRKAFGEQLDPIPVLNPRRDIGGQTFNLGWWQLAGAGLMVPRAWVLCDDTGTIVSAAESWNPNQDIAMHPTVTHPSTGVYAVTYAATALDEDGVARLIGLRACAVQVQATTYLIAGAGAVSGGNVIDIQIGFPATATLDDEPFLALFW